jgi:hypothetical protein
MKIVLLIDLPLNLTFDAQADHIRVALACNSGGVGVDQSQCFLERCHALPCSFLFLLHAVLEVAREGLDLLDLLRKIRSQAAQLVDDIGFDVAGFVCFDDGLLVEVAKYAVCVVEAALGKERSGGIGVVDDVGDLEQAFGTVLIRRRNLAKVGDEVFEELAPSCQMLVYVPSRLAKGRTLEALG